MPRQASVEEDSALPQIGEVIADRYRVEAVIGAGAMGAVLRCHHLGLGQDVAVKVLVADRCARPDVARRFAREAQSASRLDHPSCVRVLDFGSWIGRDGREARYLAMELVPGFELRRLLDTPMPVEQATAFTRQMLDGLAHAHSRGIVHRDVKPQNVIVTTGPGGEQLVKLVDFGIAKILTGDGAKARMTTEGLICGTPHYMSPEQITGAPVDGRTDLYSVGVLLYRMLTAKLPFSSNDLRKVMRMHIVEAVPPLPDHVPTPLREFVTTLLQKDRNYRQVSAAAARDELDAIIAGTSLHASPTRRSIETRSAFETLDVGTALGGGSARSSTRGRIAIRASGTENDRPVVSVAPKPTPTPTPKPKVPLRWIGWGAAIAIGAAAIVLTQPEAREHLENARDVAVAGATSSNTPDARDRAMDLRAAARADEPCLAFASALARLDRAGDPHDLVLLGDIDVPKARAHDDPTTQAICDELPRLVLGVRSRLAKLGHARR